MWTVTFIIILSMLEDKNAELPPCYTDFFFMYKCKLDFNKIRLPVNETQLNEFCSIHRYYKCYHYFNLDYPQDLLCGWTLVLDKAKPFIDSLCTEGDSNRETYLEYALCLKAIESYSRNCGAFSQNIFDFYLKMPQGSLKIKKELESCIKGGAKLLCITENLYRVCGPEAESLFAKLVSSTDPLSLYCKESDHLPSQYAFHQISNELKNVPLYELKDKRLIA